LAFLARVGLFSFFCKCGGAGIIPLKTVRVSLLFSPLPPLFLDGFCFFHCLCEMLLLVVFLRLPMYFYRPRPPPLPLHYELFRLQAFSFFCVGFFILASQFSRPRSFEARSLFLHLFLLSSPGSSRVSLFPFLVILAHAISSEVGEGPLSPLNLLSPAKRSLSSITPLTFCLASSFHFSLIRTSHRLFSLFFLSVGCRRLLQLPLDGLT